MCKKLVMIIMAGCCNGHRILMSVIVFCVLGMSVTPLSADRMCPVVDAQCEENRILYPLRLPKGVKVPELSLSLFRDTVTGLTCISIFEISRWSQHTMPGSNTKDYFTGMRICLLMAIKYTAFMDLMNICSSITLSLARMRSRSY